jgi:hypothetical protein
LFLSVSFSFSLSFSVSLSFFYTYVFAGSYTVGSSSYETKDPSGITLECSLSLESPLATSVSLGVNALSNGGLVLGFVSFGT